MLPRFAMASLMIASTLSAQPVFNVEGYAESNFLANSQNRSKGITCFTVEPSIAFENGITLHTHIGFQHPAEKGEWSEVEIEALSLDKNLSENTIFSFGKMHLPVGLYNLYHEPIYFLTIEPSRVEYLVIPTEWHETAALITHKIDSITLIAGAMTPMDASKLKRSTWIHDGKESYLTGGKRAGWLMRADAGDINSLLYGVSIVSTPLIGTNTQATLIEIHGSARFQNGWEGNAIISKGWIGDPQSVSIAAKDTISKTAKGASLTIGYDIGEFAGLSHHTLIAFGHSEYANPSSPLENTGLGGTAHAAGMDWFITPSIVAKTEIRHSNHEGDRIGIGIGFVY
ncbi:MAG: hypothetical protein PHO27_03085 [Sulfuricurvum sp.]|nr:hypothetical protein [Sulfuricurvum sp.]